MLDLRYLRKLGYDSEEIVEVAEHLGVPLDQLDLRAFTVRPAEREDLELDALAS